MIRYKASKNQIRFYNREKNKKEALFNYCLLYRIEEEIKLEELVKYLVDLNEVFRTYILIEDGVYYQVVKDTDKVNITTTYISTPNLDIIKNLNKYKFNLDYNEKSNEALIKFSIIKVLDIVYLHIVTTHICFDIYSEIVLLEQINNYYNGIYSKPHLNYIKFTEDEENETKEECKNWWLNYIRENKEWLNYLPINGQSFLISECKLGYEKINIQELKTYCKNRRFIVFPFILTIFQLYLFKNFNISKTNIRIPIYNRNKDYLETTIGCIFNMLYIIRDVKDKDIVELYKENIKDIIELNKRSMFSSEELKKYFNNEIKNNYYIINILDNSNSIDSIYINNKEWKSIYVEENLQGDIYIEIWKNEIYIKYNSIVFNKTNLKLEILKDLLSSLN
jgi:hypothetical protein